MRRKLPLIRTNKQILIICEGHEEYDYLDSLKKCGVWSSKYDIKLKNAKALDNISPQYQYEYQNNNYDIILIFCDTEMAPCNQYKKLVENINAFHGKSISKQIIYFGNPCTMQLILSHFGSIKLSSNSKTVNSKQIKTLTGVSDYNALDNQRAAIMKKITSANYNVMKSNLSSISNDDKVVPSTNFLELLQNLENDDYSWIDRLNKKLLT